jgi:hypothetical protein
LNTQHLCTTLAIGTASYAVVLIADKAICTIFIFNTAFADQIVRIANLFMTAIFIFAASGAAGSLYADPT